jgi:hypothetical protein
MDLKRAHGRHDCLTPLKEKAWETFSQKRQLVRAQYDSRIKMICIVQLVGSRRFLSTPLNTCNQHLM